jgi:7-carboxy-7-deazaguanine synthase
VPLEPWPVNVQCEHLSVTYPLSREGVFRTIQGEGSLLGVPMVFVRLAGCSVGCAHCDTDYRVHERLSAAEIGARVQALVRGSAGWVWVTGGEPADYNLEPLLYALRSCGFVALATSGAKLLGNASRFVYFLSVSPHGTPEQLVVRQGSQINLVPGLNGLRLSDWLTFDASGFPDRWVTPLWNTQADRPERVAECLEFLASRPDWRLGVQAHKLWGLP